MIHRLSGGITSPYTTNVNIIAELRERAAVRGWRVIEETIDISTPRPGMKVGVCDCEEVEP